MTETRASQRPKLLLVNDDGIDAPGLAALRAALVEEYEVLVVAPLSERSGAGCSLSLNEEMAVIPREEDGVTYGYAVDGTPADCVKFALTALGGYRPDLVLSGVNRGRNVGNFVWYSGTVAGALEATMFGMRALAVSLAVYRDQERRFDAAALVAARLVPWLLRQSWQPRSFWNLNVPNLSADAMRGVRFTHQGTCYFVDEFAFSREADGVRYYKNIGSHMELSPEPEHSDDIAIEEGWASLSLLSSDLTIEMPAAAREALEREWDSLVFEPRRDS